MEFAFPDGVLEHVCAECPAICCKGYGFGGHLRREMGRLLELYPPLAATASSRERDVLHLANPTSGCMLLTSGNLCAVEVDHGKALKPGTCVVFPFNSFRRIGRVIMVAPHLLCPLRLVVPARPGQVRGTHATIRASIAQTRLLDPTSGIEVRPVRLHATVDARGALAQELAFRVAAAGALGRRGFRATLLELSNDPTALRRSAAEAARLLKLPRWAAGPRDRIDDILLALAGTFRLGMLHLPAESMLIALAVGEHVVRHALKLAPRDPTIQDVATLWDNAAPALRLLGQGEVGVDLSRDGALRSPPLSDPELVMASVVAVRRMKDGIRAALNEALTDTIAASDRLVLLSGLGRLVDRSHDRSR